jgi:hypothetical protein
VLQPVQKPFGGAEPLKATLLGHAIRNAGPACNKVRRVDIAGDLATGMGISTTDIPAPCWLNPMDAPQLGVPQRIETNDDRSLDAVRALGPGGGRFFLVSNRGSCGVGSDTCVRVTEVAETAPTVLGEWPIIAPNASLFFPAVTTDSSGNLILVMNRSSPTEYVSVVVTGRRPTDFPSQARPLTLLKVGGGPYTGGRWGDYSGATVDWADPRNVIVTAELPLGTFGGSTLVWGTWIHHLSHVDFPP